MTKLLDNSVLDIDQLKMRLIRLIDQLPQERLSDLLEELEEEEEEADLTEDELAEVVSFEAYNGPDTYQGDWDEGFAAKYADQEAQVPAEAWENGLIGDVVGE